MSGVFISYRRDDSGGYAGRLFDMLTSRFGEANVFMDLDGIHGGDNFVTVIEEKVSQCGVLLAVIGERWLTITGVNGSPRLTAPQDWVRLEIGKALERGVRVIPVLVGNARMPHQSDLPEDLRGLALRQAMDLRDAHFREDAEKLIGVIGTFDPGIAKPRWSGRGVGYAAAAAAFVMGALLFTHIKSGTGTKHEAAGTGAQTGVNPAVQPSGSPAPPQITSAPSAREGPPPTSQVSVAGKWKASVSYKDWQGVQVETFNLEVEGTEVTGTASFLGTDHEISSGKIAGDRISFVTKSGTELNDKIYQEVHTYKGIVSGDTIQFSMATDDGVDGSRSTDRITAQRVRK